MPCGTTAGIHIHAPPLRCGNRDVTNFPHIAPRRSIFAQMPGKRPFSRRIRRGFQRFAQFGDEIGAASGPELNHLEEDAAITFAAPIAPVTAGPRQPRAIGRARVTARLRAGRSVLGELYQQGASKVLLPRTGGSALTAVTLNTAGGMTGGDSFQIAARAETGAHLVVTTQAAERVYRAQDNETAALTCHLTVQDNARLDWLPQETILFDRCALTRRLTADLGANAAFLMVEPLIFGRAAMGETLTAGAFRERIEVRRQGALVFAAATRLTGDIQKQLDHPATAGGARAMASLLYVAANAETHLNALRSLLPATAGASLIRDGVLFARILAPDGYTLRQSLLPAITRLSGAPLPRTWML